MNQEIFETELTMCHKFLKEKGGCKWGECDKCGVIPLLYKIYKGEIYEDENDIKRIKNNNKIYSIVLSQIRVISSKRLLRKAKKISSENFNSIKKAFIEMIITKHI